MAISEWRVANGFCHSLFGLLAGAAIAFPAAAADSATDFSGMWARNAFDLEQPPSGPGPVVNTKKPIGGTSNVFELIGDHTNPILKPEAAEILKQRSAMIASGRNFPDPSNHCGPYSPPFVFAMQLGLQVVQTKNQITFLYNQDDQVRRIRMNARHPAKVSPTAMGDSVGHFEGDTLVIDTVGIKVGPFTVTDRFGTPQSEAMHVVERYRLIDAREARAAADLHEKIDGRLGAGRTTDPAPGTKGLQLQLTIEDPKYFTSPWFAQVTYQRSPQEWQEQVCAENFHEYYGENHDTAIPQATKPDF